MNVGEATLLKIEYQPHIRAIVFVVQQPAHASPTQRVRSELSLTDSGLAKLMRYEVPDNIDEFFRSRGITVPTEIFDLNDQLINRKQHTHVLRDDGHGPCKEGAGVWCVVELRPNV